MGSAEKIYFSFNSEIVIANFRFFKFNKIIWWPSWICGIKKSTDIISDHLDNFVL